MLVSSSAMLVACSSGPTIGEVLARPEKFGDSTITLRGRVVDPSGLSLLGASMWSYKLVDGRDTLTVVGRTEPTRKTERTSVVGRVRGTMMLGLVRIGPVFEEIPQAR